MRGDTGVKPLGVRSSLLGSRTTDHLLASRTALQIAYHVCGVDTRVDTLGVETSLLGSRVTEKLLASGVGLKMANHMCAWKLVELCFLSLSF